MRGPTDHCAKTGTKNKVIIKISKNFFMVINLVK